MSDILSAIETRRYESGRIVTDPVIPSSNYGNDSSAAGRYGKVILPGNLYIVGTVNMDETTFPFSKKVLDRANTIEFSYVDLLSMPTFSTQSAEQISVQNDFLASKYITLNDCDAEDEAYIINVCTKLKRINDELEKANAHIGYRVRDEIVFYMLNNKKAELLEENVAFDNQIMQKILPRIQGSSRAIKDVLSEEVEDISEEDLNELAKNYLNNRVNFIYKRWGRSGSFFDRSSELGTTTVTVNVDHDFYKNFFEKACSDPDTKTTFELFLAAFAVATDELDVSQQDQNDNVLSEWNLKLRNYILKQFGKL
jgi:hypothetical protein